MQCPIDQTTLAMTERQGIEIDYCPACRGVWLDRGELDKLIGDGGSDSRPSNQPSAPPQNSAPPQTQYPDRQTSYSDDRSDKYGKKRKKESFLSDLFDF